MVSCQTCNCFPLISSLLYLSVTRFSARALARAIDSLRVRSTPAARALDPRRCERDRSSRRYASSAIDSLRVRSILVLDDVRSMAAACVIDSLCAIDPRRHAAYVIDSLRVRLSSSLADAASTIETSSPPPRRSLSRVEPARYGITFVCLCRCLRQFACVV